MSDIRPELSKHSKYWISRHRYYELKHFVMQFPEWIKESDAIDSMVSACKDPAGRINNISDPVGRAVEKREVLNHNISMCRLVSRETDWLIGEFYILPAIYKGLSYDDLRIQHNIPCSKDTYYDLYHKFFWLLDRARK